MMIKIVYFLWSQKKKKTTYLLRPVVCIKYKVWIITKVLSRRRAL